MEFIFFSFLFFSIYPYLIYPGILYVMSRFLNNSWNKGEIAPRITLIISVYNEERVISQKVQNALSLKYPKDLFEIIVISDGSNDGTNEIVSKFNDSRLILRAFPERSGKTACLNRIVPEAKGDIILFTDANSMFDPDVLLRLVKNFLDEKVGLVTGWTKYVREKGGDETTGIYSRFEMKTKYWESLVSSCVGADGAIFAVRKELYRPLDVHDINDLVIPLNVILQAKRVVLDSNLFCFEAPSKGEHSEYLRQARITNRTLRAVLGNPKFLNPFFNGYFSFFLLSHKLLRFMVPFFLMGAFLVNLLLLEVSSSYIGLFLIQILFLSLGLANLVGNVDARVANISKFLLITLSAQVTGWVRFVRGISDTLWTPER